MRGRLGGELRRLGVEPDDPRLVQTGFSVLYLLDLGLRAAGSHELRTGPLVGLVLVPVVWVLTALVP